MKLISSTFDCPANLKQGVETLANALCLTNPRGGKGGPNTSQMARILRAVSIEDQTGFETWLDSPRVVDNGQKVSMTVQATEQELEEIRELAMKLKILKVEGGEKVANMSEILRRLMEYPLENRIVLSGWFSRKVNNG